jgi:probable HAF family extracellular repeat protein
MLATAEGTGHHGWGVRQLVVDWRWQQATGIAGGGEMSARTVRAHVLLTLVLVGFLLAPLTPRPTLAGTAASAAPMSITDLGDGYAYGINDAGQVVGQSNEDAFLWSSSGGMIDLGKLGGSSSQANGINSGGQIVGTTGTRSGVGRAFLWNASTGMQDLGSLAGSNSYGYGINDAGQVVGWTIAAISGDTHAFLWDASSGMTDLGTLGGPGSIAFGLNTSGQVAGSAETPNVFNPNIGLHTHHAFLWNNGVMTDLGTLPGATSPNDFSIAYGINSSGHVVGESDTGVDHHAFLWSNSVMTDLGIVHGGPDSVAHGINISDQVVGTSGRSAFLWSPSAGMIDLNTLIPSGSGWNLTDASAINDNGQIVGVGTINGQTHAYLLTPGSPSVPCGEGVPVTLNPTSGPAGTMVTATGCGWAPGAQISVAWENQQHLIDTTVDGSGGFTVSFSVPANATQGAHQVFFSQSCTGGCDSRIQIATFTVTLSSGFGPSPVKPGGLWIGPNDGDTFTNSVHFAAHAYPTNPGDPPIKEVDFTALYNGSWAKVCQLFSPTHADVYECDWHFAGAPAGPIQVSFDVYDTAGNQNPAPNGIHTIIYAPPGTPPNIGSPLPASADTGFLPSRDGFGFENKGWRDDNRLKQTLPMFFQEFGKFGGFSSLIGFSPQIGESLAFLFALLYLGQGQGGSCYGFSTASGINWLQFTQDHAGAFKLPDYYNPLKPQPESKAIDQSIAFYQGTQLSADVQDQMLKENTWSVKQLLTEIETSIAKRTPVVISVQGYRPDLDGIVAHALLAYKYVTDSKSNVSVSVYDSNFPADNRFAPIADKRTIMFTHDSNGTWHWSYQLGQVPVQGRQVWVYWQDGCVKGRGCRGTHMWVTAVRTATNPGEVPWGALFFGGAQGLSITDALRHSSSVDASGQLTGNLPGVLPVIPDDTANVPGAGLLYVRQPSAYTITESPATTGAASFALLAAGGGVAVAETGATQGRPLIVAVDQTRHDVAYRAGSPGGRVTITFEQVQAGARRTVVLSGLGADMGVTRVVRLSRDQQSISVTGGKTGTSYSLATMQQSRSGIMSSSIMDGLSVPANTTETVHLGGTARGRKLTIAIRDRTGRVRSTAASLDVPLTISGRQPVAPGRTVRLTAAPGTFRPGASLSLRASGLIRAQTGRASRKGGANLRLTVPVTAQTGNYIITVSGPAGSPHASGVITVAASTILAYQTRSTRRPTHTSTRHYAHLHLTVPPGWHLDRAATGKNALTVFSDSRHAALFVVSVLLPKTPSSADLQGLPPTVLQQEFKGVTNITPLSFKDQIDGHKVFAAQGSVSIANRPSLAIAIVTNKNRWIYAFTVANYSKQALPSEIHAALAAIFGAKLD